MTAFKSPNSTSKSEADCTTEVRWLIECRDRPTEGPAPSSWIEQLVGRRGRFGFNKVTAVSTTGFAKGASDFAKREGIETRQVKALTPEDFADWLVMRSIIQVEQSGRLEHATFVIDENESPNVRKRFVRRFQPKVQVKKFCDGSKLTKRIVPHQPSRQQSRRSLKRMTMLCQVSQNPLR